MDLVAACRAFVAVSDRGSFTVGAAAAGMQQAAASRRIVALEEHLGDALFDRTTRGARLTSFGRSILPAARQLTAVAEELDAQAARARSEAIHLVLPRGLPPVDVAALIVAAQARGATVDVGFDAPAGRESRLKTGLSSACLVATAPSEAEWTIELGAGGSREETGPFFLDTIRPGRSDSRAVTLFVGEEDRVPAIQDRLHRIADARGLLPYQITADGSLPAALASVAQGDLLLCSEREAERFGLSWRPLADIRLTRNYALRTADSSDSARVHRLLAEAVSRCLGSQPSDGAAHDV